MERVLIRVVFCLAFLMLTFSSSANTDRKQAMIVSKRAAKGECKENLRDFYVALTNYAALNNGKLPAKNNLAGLQDLLAHGVTLDNFYCSYYKGEKYKENKKSKKKDTFQEKNSAYIYFGGINLTSSRINVPKMIVMCDKFFAAGSGHLRVLLIDGSVLELKSNKLALSGKAVKLENIVGLIDYLAKKYQYPQDVYQILRNKAAAMDAEFSAKEKKK